MKAAVNEKFIATKLDETENTTNMKLALKGAQLKKRQDNAYAHSEH